MMVRVQWLRDSVEAELLEHDDGEVEVTLVMPRGDGPYEIIGFDAEYLVAVIEALTALRAKALYRFQEVTL